MPNQNPEQLARDQIDQQLLAGGWVIQDKTKVNLSAALGIAVREYLTDAGPADYVLFVDKKPLGVIEAKRLEEGVRLSGQSSQFYLVGVVSFFVWRDARRKQCRDILTDEQRSQAGKGTAQLGRIGLTDHLGWLKNNLANTPPRRKDTRKVFRTSIGGQHQSSYCCNLL